MEKVLGTNSLLLHDGRGMELEYFMLENRVSDRGISIYGIGIRKLQDGKTETELVEHVTESESKARKWIASLVKNQVTPVCLVETLDDFITAEGV